MLHTLPHNPGLTQQSDDKDKWWYSAGSYLEFCLMTPTVNIKDLKAILPIVWIRVISSSHAERAVGIIVTMIDFT